MQFPLNQKFQPHSVQTKNVSYHSLNSSHHKQSNPGAELIEMSRDFKVSVEVLFSAFQSAEAIKLWWWPKGLYADRVEYDFREGGDYFISMKGFDQGGGGMTGSFDEIVENKRIVMLDSFADENGNVITAAEAKMPGNWPESVYITFEFTNLEDQASRLTLFQEGIPNEVQKECQQGWSEMFDKLDRAVLALSLGEGHEL